MAQSHRASFAQRLEDAKRVHARGDGAGAVRLFSALNAEHPDHPAILHSLGVALAQSGRLNEAEAPLLRAVRLAPEIPDIRFDLAALYDAQAKAEEAERVLRELVERHPHYAKAWESIGMIRRDAGDFRSAGRAYAVASRLQPLNPDLALTAAEHLPVEEAAVLLAETLERLPNEERLLLPLAEVLLRSDRLEETEQILLILKARQPQLAVVHRHLGVIYGRMRKRSAAAAALYDAIQIDPNDAAAWEALGEIRDLVGDPEGALAAVDRAIEIQPADLALHGLRLRIGQDGMVGGPPTGGVLPEIARSAEARLLSAMLMPPILDSNEQIDALRTRWMETMEDVEKSPTFVAEPWETIAVTGYSLGYQGREDRPLMEAYARATLATSPHLAYESPRLGSGEGRMRVGFLSAYMREHSVGRVLVRLMGSLDSSRFETVLLQLPGKRNGGQAWAGENADRTVQIPTNLEHARRAIEEERLDALVFCDMHLTPFADALAHGRLAPVQATTWGHPGTCGHSSIDYWISCEDWEPVGNERLYSEKLVRLAMAPFVYHPSCIEPSGRTREQFGLPTGARLYGCLQSIYKLHPDFDAIVGRILEQDPKAVLVLVEGKNRNWEKAIRARFARSFDPGRVASLPRMDYERYLAVVDACDVLLDPIHFGGGLTTLDALTVGKPVVTLDGDQMRNRMAGGFYRQMGYERLIADDAQKYVELALRLAQDRRFYREAKEAILDSNAVLFDNPAPVRPLEEWLLSVRK